MGKSSAVRFAESTPASVVNALRPPLEKRGFRYVTKDLDKVELLLHRVFLLSFEDTSKHCFVVLLFVLFPKFILNVQGIPRERRAKSRSI